MKREKCQAYKMVERPSGLSRWFEAPVSTEARVQIPPMPKLNIIAK